MSELIALDILQKVSKERVTRSIPFLAYSDMRGKDLRDAPDLWHETEEFNTAIDADNFQLIIGTNGSGKTLLLCHQEVKFLETFVKDLEVKVLPVWFDIDSLISYNDIEFKSENQFHVRIARNIMTSTLKTIEEVENPSIWQKARFRSIKRKSEKPIHKTIIKSGKKRLQFFDVINVGYETGKSSTEQKEIEFSFDDLERFLKLIREVYNIDVIKVLVDEVSTLTIYDEAKHHMDSTRQKWFFNFVNKCRKIKDKTESSTGLSFSIVVLPTRMELGENLKVGHHIRPIFLDVEEKAVFSKLTSDVLDKRITHYTNGKFSSYTDLFKGNRTNCPAKNLLDKASSWIPRSFLELCQDSFEFIRKANSKSEKKNYHYITQKMVQSVLKKRARMFESMLSMNHQKLYLQLMKAVSDIGKARFIFEVDDMGEIPNTIRNFVHRLIKDNIIIKKRSEFIFNQIIWYGTQEKIKRDLVFKGDIPVLEYSDGAFTLQREKKPEVKKHEEVDWDAFDDDEDTEEEDSELIVEEIIEAQEIEEGSPEFFDDVAKELETKNLLLKFKEKSDSNFPVAHIVSIVKRYSNISAREVYNHCIKVVRIKTYSIIEDLANILMKKNRRHIKPWMIDDLRKNDEDLKDVSLLPEKRPDLVFTQGRIRKILKELWHSAGIAKDAYEPLLRYIEDWLSIIVLKAIRNKNNKEPSRKTLMLKDFESDEDFKGKVLRIEWKEESGLSLIWKRVPEDLTVDEAKRLIDMGVAEWDKLENAPEFDNN